LKRYLEVPKEFPAVCLSSATRHQLKQRDWLC